MSAHEHALPDARVVRTAAGGIEVADTGAPTPHAPVLIGVHGTPGDWRQTRVLASLARQARLLFVSRPGYGHTPLDRRPTPDAQADLLAALLDHLDLPGAAVFGVSGGGPTAFAFAGRHPDRCTGLVLVSAVAVHLPVVAPGLRLAAALPPLHEAALVLARRRGARVSTDERQLAALIEAELGPAERDALDAAGRRLLADFAADRVHALRGGAGMRADSRAFHRARGGAAAAWPAGTAMRVEILHGDADPVVPVVHAHHYAQAIPGARLTVVPGARHAILISRRDLVLDAVRRVLTPATATGADAAAAD